MDDLIDIKNLGNTLGGVVVHAGLNFSVKKGETVGIIGGSGAGKTTLLRNILMLLPPTTGSIRLFGVDVLSCSDRTTSELRQRFGVMFQQGALFSGLTVLENILFPLEQFASLPKALATELGLLKIKWVGLPLSAAHKLPGELSGGMLKRAAAARALALDPELLILDEPTTGLDPRSSADFDRLLANLRDMLGLTLLLVSHDVASLERLGGRVAFLGDGKVLASGPLDEVRNNPHPMIKSYFTGE